MTDKGNWYVFYTKSRHEKKVRDLLHRRGFEVFLPMQKVMRQWSDRKKKVEVPLFNSYIFVLTTMPTVQEVLQVPGVAWAIRHNGKPAILQDKEYQTIHRFLETGLSIEILPAADVEVGDWVKVMDGSLKGAVGQVSSKNPGRFMVLLEAIGQVMRVEIAPELLKRV